MSMQLDQIILSNVAKIEAWFRQEWQKTLPSITSSVDLRHAGFKLAPVDTNLFPAGFNNLNPDCLCLCVQAIQATLFDYAPNCCKLLLLPEMHTRNPFYLQSLAIFKNILIKAGFTVRIGSLDVEQTQPLEMTSPDGESLLFEPLVRENNRLGLEGFNPCVVVLNNDLSTGIPESLRGLDQPIIPPPELGWSNRLKSDHFSHYDHVAESFAQLIDIDPWLVNPYFAAVENVDFMTQAGIDNLVDATAKILQRIRDKYEHYAIKEKPFVAVKADNGTYGMSVMMVHDAQELLQLNRKQRTKMAASKGSQKVSRVIIQEGVYTFETVADNAVAEPVVYMLGSFVVGGFYRVHKERGINENLNAPGMHFEPLPFTKPCNLPSDNLDPKESANLFYIYGVIARLAALAAAREIKAYKDQS